jgi:hypothetical protein
MEGKAMKHVSTALLVLLASVSSMAQTKTTFDKFKNITHLATGMTETSKVTYDGGKDASILIRRMEMTISFACEGQVDSCKPTGVELLFVAHTSDWVMNERNRVVNLLSDGKPDNAGKASWDGQVLEAENLVEYNDTTISPELLTKLARAKTIEVQIGLFEFSLTDANLASIRDIAGHAGWLPEALKKAIIENVEASKMSPAAAAQFAQDGHITTQPEMAQLVLIGQASKTAIITSPVGAEVYIDGNKGGVTPLIFFLIKRDNPRVLTIKQAGYKTVEKTFIPNGKDIPIAVTLEKEQ